MKFIWNRDSEIKLDVTWSYVKRQTAKMTSEFVFFSSNPSLSHIKNRKMSPTIRHKEKYFHFTVQRAKDKQQKFHFPRLPFDVRRRNVKLNLSNNSYLYCGCRRKWRVIIAVNFPIYNWKDQFKQLTSLPMCGFIAQLVEHRTGIAEVTGLNPVEALIFFRLLLSNIRIRLD